MQYCSPPEPMPLQIMAAPLVCVAGPFTQAASVNFSDVSKFKLGLSGMDTYCCGDGGAVALKLSAPLRRPATHSESSPGKLMSEPSFALPEESTAVEPVASSNFHQAASELVM